MFDCLRKGFLQVLSAFEFFASRAGMAFVLMKAGNLYSINEC